jgi:hypothetical protein
LGGGAPGHAGLLLSAVEYDAMAPGTPFVFPANPGVYPAGVIPASQQLQYEAEHKTLVRQFQTCVELAKGLKELIFALCVRTASATNKFFECHTISNDASPSNAMGCIGFC